MALLKVSEFAEAYRIPRPNVYTYQKRGKLIIINGFVDTDNMINQLFLSNRQKVDIKKEPQKVYKQPKTPAKQPLSETKVYTDTQKKVRIITEKDSTESNKIFIKSEEIKQRKTEEELKSLQIKNERALKILIPRQDVGLIHQSYLNRFTMNFNQRIEVLVRDYLNQLQADNKLIKEACSKITDISNECIDLATEEIKMGVNNLSND
jgi:hypothetical protein